MRVAGLYDIHGNLPALDSVLADVRTVGVDTIVIGGDVLPGPLPAETLQSLLDLEIPTRFIRGNGETAVLAEITGAPTSVPEQFRDITRWVAKQIKAQYQEVIETWPQTVTLRIDGLGEVLFCHATPRSENEIFTRATADERVLRAFGGIAQRTVVCGHTHMQFDRHVAEIRIINAGSVGMPYGEPGAYWALLGPDVELRHVTYDLDAAAARIRSSGYPRADEFVRSDLLNPRSSAEMEQLFAKAELH